MSLRFFLFSVTAFFLSLTPASFAQSNQAPEFISGEAEAPVLFTTSRQQFSTTWRDTEDDFIVDVTLRYKHEKLGMWQEVILDWVPGSEPPRFQKGVVIDGPEGDYIFEFRASDAETENGPRLHTTVWHYGGRFYMPDAHPREIGRAIEQGEIKETLSLPVARIHPAQIEVYEGEIIDISAEGTVPSGGTPYYYWRDERGTMFSVPHSENFQDIKYLAPSVPGRDQRFRIWNYIGDNLGHVTKTHLDILVKESGNTDPLDPSPEVVMELPNVIIAGKSFNLLFNISDFNKYGENTSEKVIIDLYYQVGNGDWEVLRRSVHNSQELIWAEIPRLLSAPHRIKAEVSDGNTFTTIVSPDFSVTPRKRVFGSILSPAHEGIPGIKIAITDSQGETVYTFTEEYGRYDLDLWVDEFTISPVGSGSHEFLPSSSVLDFTDQFDQDSKRNFIRADPSGPSVQAFIDIKPGNEQNILNLFSNGKTKVGILTNDHLNAEDILPESLTFGSTGDELSLHLRGNGVPNCQMRDINADGRDDLVCHFHTSIADFSPNSSVGILRGVTLSGIPFEGEDAIIFPCFDVPRFEQKVSDWPSTALAEVVDSTECIDPS